MPSDQRQRDWALLDLANLLAGLPQDRQEAFVREWTPAGSELQQQALRLLAANAVSSEITGTDGVQAAAQALTLPEKIGPYRVLASLGAGSMGQVFLGRRTGVDFEHDVAIKLVPQLAQVSDFNERMKTERRLLARLRHPNIAQMYDGGETGAGTPYIVMEFVDGRQLAELIDNIDFDWGQRSSVFRDVCRALVYAHQAGIVHRDLSLSNILIDRLGTAKLIDFGISAAKPSAEVTGGFERAVQKDIADLGGLLRALTKPETLPRRGDLNAIIAGAERAGGDDGYCSVSALASDFEKYLAGQAPQVSKPKIQTRLARFVQRHRTATVSAFAALGIVGALAMGLTSYRIQLTDSGNDAAQRLEAARNVAIELIDLSSQDAVVGRSPTQARQDLIQRSLAVIEALRETEASPELSLELARGYARLAEVMGVGGGSNLGQREHAGQLLQTANEILAAVPEDAANGQKGRRVRLETLVISARNTFYLEYNTVTSADLVHEAADIFATIENPSPRDQMLMADGEMSLAMAHFHSETPQIGIDAAWRSVERLEKLAEETPGEPDRSLLFMLSQAHGSLAQAVGWAAYYAEKPLDGAIPHYQRSIEYAEDARKLGGLEADRIYILSLLRRANTTCYMDAHRADAIEDLRSIEPLTEALVSADPENAQAEEILTNVILQLSDCLFNNGDHSDAIATAREAVQRQRSTLARDPQSPGRIYRVIATERVLRWIQEGSGDADGACETASRVREMWASYDAVATSERSESMQDAFDANEAVLKACPTSSD
ncbi:MAG: serine/threonine-protein kinase [Pseudomonadota bacterium]